MLAAPTNLLNNVIRIRSAYNGHLGSEPLLEGLRDEVAVGREPSGEGGADVDRLRVFVVPGVAVGYVDFVDGDVFFCGGAELDLVGEGQ